MKTVGFTVENQAVLTRFEETLQEIPELAEVIGLQRELFETSLHVQLHAPLPILSREQVVDSLYAGFPLLRRQTPELDWEGLVTRSIQVCQIAARHRTELAPQFEQIAGGIEADPEQIRAWTAWYLAGCKEPLGHPLDGAETESHTELVRFVLLHALRPALRQQAAALAPLIDETIWHREICPVCGGEPDLAYLDDRSRTRHLVCPQCDFTWLFARVKCPFCLTTDSSDLAYFPSEDEKYRLYVCQRCKRYLKAVDLEKAGRRIVLEVERVATLPIDFTAQEHGYI